MEEGHRDFVEADPVDLEMDPLGKEKATSGIQGMEDQTETGIFKIFLKFF